MRILRFTSSSTPSRPSTSPTKSPYCASATAFFSAASSRSALASARFSSAFCFFSSNSACCRSVSESGAGGGGKAIHADGGPSNVPSSGSRKYVAFHAVALVNMYAESVRAGTDQAVMSWANAEAA